MPAPIYIEEKSPWADAFKNLLPVIMNAFMAKTYLNPGISETEFEQLKEQVPDIEKYLTKKGKKYVLNPAIGDLSAIQDANVKDVLLEYYRRENLKEKIKSNPFTYLGGIQHIITNPVVMAYLSDITGTLKEKKEGEKKKKTKETLSKFLAPALFQALMSNLPQTMQGSEELKDLESLDISQVFSMLMPFMFLNLLERRNK